MFLTKAKVGETVSIVKIEGKEKNRRFFFSLGCFEGESITLISILGGNYIINIKEGRYAIDESLAKSIIIQH